MRLEIRLQPKASADRIDHCECLENGAARLRCRVTGVPEKGKANAALVTLLAKTWRIPKSAIAIVAGETARNKMIEIDEAWRDAVMNWVRENASPVASPPP